MSQITILELLKKEYKKNKDRWFTTLEITKKLEQGRTSVTLNLRRLRKTDFIVHRREYHKGYNTYFYKYRK